jgi:hypothetical protein
VVVLTVARRTSPAGGCGTLVGVLLLVGLAILVIKWALITAAILAVPFGVWWLVDRSRQRRRVEAVGAAAARRAEVESRAVVDAAGGCGWCGSRIPHRDDRTGAPVTPRRFHHDEIEETIAPTA